MLSSRTSDLQNRSSDVQSRFWVSIQPDKCFGLLLPLYRLGDAGDLWHKTFDKHLVKEINLKPTVTDPSLYFSFSDENLIGINGSYVDDLLRAGRSEFKSLCNRTHERIKRSVNDSPPFTFAGYNIEKQTDVPYAIDQTFYIPKLEELDNKTSFQNFR